MMEAGKERGEEKEGDGGKERGEEKEGERLGKKVREGGGGV